MSDWWIVLSVGNEGLVEKNVRATGNWCRYSVGQGLGARGVGGEGCQVRCHEVTADQWE